MNAPKISAAIVIFLSLTACFLWLKWKHDEPRRYCLQTLQDLDTAIDSNPAGILDDVIIPKALAGRTRAEQAGFLDKALQSEISPAGIAALNRHAAFGSLTNLFPNDGVRWAEQAGVKPEDCVALRMERNGIRAEVVLARESDSYQVVRCNNVRQMAGGN